jgi:hypothetical protein
MSQSLDQLADIKPGHPIWDEVWERSRPGGISHLSQLFEAKLQVAALEAQVEALQLVLEAARKIRHWHDDEKIGGMVVSADAVRELWGALASYDASRAAQPAPQEGK